MLPLLAAAPLLSPILPQRPIFEGPDGPGRGLPDRAGPFPLVASSLIFWPLVGLVLWILGTRALRARAP
jgi:hypothetical protein